MEDWELEVKNHWNQVSDSDWYKSLRTEERLTRLRQDPATAFHPEMLSLIKKHVGDFSGKKILLPSSGDNHAAFAFALMGAKVTSADISERQLENAKEISDSWGLDIEYICDNTMYLSKIADASYDLVYTSNGTLTWIGDLNEMYRNVARVLNEAWKAPTIKKSYYDVFPDLHWRVQDIVNSNISAGLQITEMAELQAIDASFWYSFDELKTKTPADIENINDWKSNVMAALPAWLGLIARKEN